MPVISMSTKTVVILLIVILVAILGYAFMGSKSSTPSLNTTRDTRLSNAPQSLSALIQGTESQKCTFSNTQGDTSLSGTVYVAGGKARADFESKSIVTSKISQQHIITDGVNTSMWQDGESMGMVVENNVQNDTSMKSPLDTSASVPYICTPWTTDASVFVLPQNVMFHSMADMMNMGSKNTGADGKTIAPVR